MAQKEPIKNFVLHDRHGHDIDFSSFAVVGEVEVNLGDGIGEPTAESTYEGGKLTINIDNIKGDGIANIEQTPSTEDEGINIVTITCESGTVYTLQIRNGSKGKTGATGLQGPQGDSAVYDPSSPDAPDFVMANTIGDSTTKAMTQKAVTDALTIRKYLYEGGGMVIAEKEMTFVAGRKYKVSCPTPDWAVSSLDGTNASRFNFQKYENSAWVDVKVYSHTVNFADFEFVAEDLPYKMWLRADVGVNVNIVVADITDKEDIMEAVEELIEPLEEEIANAVTVESLNENIRLLNSNPELVDGVYINRDGNKVSNEDYCAIDKLPIHDLVGHKLSVWCGEVTSLDIYFTFHGENGSRIDYYKCNTVPRTGIAIPANIYFLSATFKKSGLTNAYVYDETTQKYIYKQSYLKELPAEKRLHKLTVAEWNIGGWGEGTAFGIDEDYDAQIAIIKDVLTEMNADVLFVCEWSDYTNRAGTINAYAELFKQFYPYYIAKHGWPAVLSKYPLNAKVDSHTIEVEGRDPAERFFISGSIEVGDTQVGIVCAHLNPYSGDARVEEGEMFMDGLAEYDYAIMAGDFNVGNNGESQESRDAQIAVYDGMEKGNWGYWGNKPTYQTGNKALDNIMAKAINVDSFDVDDRETASDHLPCYSKISFYK